MSAPNDIIHFFYTFSPVAQKVTWYLALRGIRYAECAQPIALPRPDLEALGIQYRRIPLLSIGRDVYCDTRLILEKLEDHFPELPRLSATKPDHVAIQRLLESWTLDGGIFARAGQTLPIDLPLLQDPKFIKDREAYGGQSWAPEQRQRSRPEALSHMRQAFDFLEDGLLSDGRSWLLGTEKPTLADINAVWPFVWVQGVPGAIPPDVVSPTSHPRVHDYIKRFRAAIKDAVSRNGKPSQLSGQEAISYITKANFAEPESSLVFDNKDPLAAQVQEGQTVNSWPVDSGFLNRDQGKLVKLDKQEVVLELPGKEGRNAIRLHHPRWNFRIKPVDRTKL